MKIDPAAMRLLVVRHAKSEKAEPGQPDRERRLNGRGERDAAAIGAYMARHALTPDLALVSTAQRTRETWQRLSPALAARPQVLYEEQLYNAGSRTVLAIVRKIEGMVPTVLILGHNPGLHDLARNLIAAGDIEARERLNEGLPTAGLVVIDFAAETWDKLHAHAGRLERFVTPRTLAAADRA